MNRIPLVLAAAVVVAAAPRPAHAADDAFGVWNIFSTTGALGTEDGPGLWRYWFDAQARYPDVGSGSNQYLARPALGYQGANNVSWWVGYARFRTRSASGAVADENRYWQQVSWSTRHRGAQTFALRARLEERDVENRDETGVVLRLMAKQTWPLAGGRSFFLSVEPFFNLRDTDWGGDSGIVQNRLIAGIAWRVSDSLTIDTGYMHQYVWRTDAEDRNNHVLVLNFKKRLRSGR
ncbi:MAG: DUF2490 domain-containing protein [Woeseiaceae bacterium]|nr:DUF2490 domain-containing protein [Woeseiaceae bacterium]